MALLGPKMAKHGRLADVPKWSKGVQNDPKPMGVGGSGVPKKLNHLVFRLINVCKKYGEDRLAPKRRPPTDGWSRSSLVTEPPPSFSKLFPT